MRVLSIDENPIMELQFLNAGKRPGGYYVDQLPVLSATVDSLPEGCDAIVATADLQGRELFPNPRTQQFSGLRLLGQVLPGFLTEEIFYESRIEPKNVGVILAGDFYTVPALNKRGGTGNVTSVWRAFGDNFKWVVGVAGNHDTFGSNRQSKPQFSGHLKYLDGARVAIDGMQMAGIRGIIGDPKRIHRRTEEDYVDVLSSIICDQTDVLIMHDGPDSPEHCFRGSSAIREAIEIGRPNLVVRGHCRWKLPFVQLPYGVQILNVECRCMLLHRGNL